LNGLHRLCIIKILFVYHLLPGKSGLRNCQQSQNLL
jgi:hypothetical protein